MFGGDGEGKPTRSGTVRSKISAPMGLVSTTNMLSYNAPDIRKGPKISAPVELTFTTNALSYDAPDIHKEPKTATSTSSLSLRSDGDSDHIHTAASSPPTSPDTAFPRGGEDDFDKSSTTPEPNHLSCYFTLPGEPSNANVPAVPSLPKRAPSHTKRQHMPLSPKSSMSERLNRKISISERMGRQPSNTRLSEQSSHSVSTKASGPFSRTSSASTSTTASSHSIGAQQMPKTSSQAPPPVPAVLPLSQSVETKEPFGQELAQVTELAEEYANSAAEKSRRINTQEERELAERGLQKFSPEEYVAEISSLISSFFGDARHVKNPAPQWI